MLKGSQKQMIVVRTRDSRLFEEAYFVMRRGRGRTGADELDMLWEANRIIESSLPGEAKEHPGTAGRPIRPPKSTRGERPEKPPYRPRLIAGLIWFGAGFAAGGGIVGLLGWIF